ncbi:MAG: TSUP family transporter [Oscillibacter sp.]|nr:TSUP family transporter [Oscillibacter sp.]
MRALLPLLCGFGCGILSAWGVGGGTLLLVVMTLLLGVEQRTAQGINLLFFLPTAASALWCHWRQGKLEPAALRAAAPAAALAALLGAWIAANVDTALLRRPFGVYLLLSAGMLLRRKGKTPPSPPGET